MTGAVFPAPPLGKRPASRSRQGECAQASRLQILVQCADRRVADHRPHIGDWECSDREAARKRFQEHKSECVGMPRKHEYIRCSIFFRERRPRRSVTDHYYCSRKIERKKGLEIFLNRDPADAEKNRARKMNRFFRPWPEQAGIDAARPLHNAFKAAHRQLLRKGGRRDHDAIARAVKPPEITPYPALGYGTTRRDVSGEIGVEACREADAMLAAIAAHGESDRTLRCDMDSVRPKLGHFVPHRLESRQGEFDFWIIRQQYTWKALGRQKGHIRAEFPRAVRGCSQGSDNAVDLRVPSIGRDQNAHQAACGSCAAAISSCTA